jgi:hypothetical protein
MAEPDTPKKGGSFLKKKIAGVPAPVVLVVGGVLVYYLYSKYKGSQSSSSSTATPTDTSGQATGTSGGYLDGGGSSGSGGGGYYDPNATSPTSATTSPTDTSAGTPAPTSTVNNPNVTPLGSKLVTIAGKSFNTVSDFVQNGTTYYGINNPAEAKRLNALGATLVQNPNDPNGKGEFLAVPKGQTPLQAINTQKAAKPKTKVTPKKKVVTKK